MSTITFNSLNIKYFVFGLFSIEHRSKRIRTSLHSVFIHLLHSVLIFLELGIYIHGLPTNAEIVSKIKSSKSNMIWVQHRESDRVDQ